MLGNMNTGQNSDNVRGFRLPIKNGGFMTILASHTLEIQKNGGCPSPPGEDYEGCNASFPSVTMEQQQQLLMFYHPEPQVPSEAHGDGESKKRLSWNPIQASKLKWNHQT